MTMKWQITDVIDLEFLFHIDASDENESGENAQRQRDRHFYLNRVKARKGYPNAASRRSMIRLWVEQRRNEGRSDDRGLIFPGDLYQELYRTLFYGIGVLGLITGIGLAWTLLSYRGTEPLNISLYLGVLVFYQILLLFLLAFFSLVKWVHRSYLHRSLIFRIIGRIWMKAALYLKRHALKNLSGSRRTRLETALNLVRGEKRLYGSLFYWPVFILVQIFGVGFNLGVLTSTLLRVAGSDLAFGWQSTLRLSAETVFQLVKHLAFPWSGVVPPEIAYPSLQQIEGSRIILKDGIHHLATPDLVSWWPFLCLAVLFYGLLPRLLLLVAGWSARNIVLGGLSFRHSDCDQLLHRMQTPLVSAQGRIDKTENAASSSAAFPSEHSTGADPGAFSAAGREAIVLIPEDIFDGCPDNPLNEIIQQRTGFRVSAKYRIDTDNQAEILIARHIDEKGTQQRRVSVILLLEAWQPPIREFLRTVKTLRKAIGPEGALTIALIGKPAPGTIFTPVSQEDWYIWRRTLKAMGDPFLRIERLVENEPS